MIDKILTLAVASTPIIFVSSTIVVNMFIDPPAKLTPKEREELEAAVRESKWATELAKAMATTPEAQEELKKLLAKSVVSTIEKWW
jgi:hypothetical protein